MRVVASTLLVVLSFLLRPLQVLLEKTKSTTSSRRRRGRRRRERRLQSGEEENNEDELLFSLSADETKWLFPHRIDPLLIEEEDLSENDRPVRAVGAKLPRVVRERVRAFFLRVVRLCEMWAFFSLSLVFSRYSLNAHLSMSLLLLLRKIKNTRERSDDVDRLRRQSSAV